MQKPDRSTAAHIVCLRQDRLRPGDVLLVRNSGKRARAISLGHPSRFTHAALFLDQHRRFEADHHGVGAAPAPCRPSEFDQARVILLPGAKNAAIYRHPDVMATPPASARACAFAAALEGAAARKVEPYSLVKRLARTTGPLEPAAEVVLEAYDHIEAMLRDAPTSRTTNDDGRFCSEVVTEVLNEVGLAPFPDNRDPAMVGPGHLTESRLVDVSADVVLLRTAEQVGITQLELGDDIQQFEASRLLVGLTVESGLAARREAEARDGRARGAEVCPAHLAPLRKAVIDCRAALERIECTADRYRLDSHVRRARALKAASDACGQGLTASRQAVDTVERVLGREVSLSAAKRSAEEGLAGACASVLQQASDLALDLEVARTKAIAKTLRKAGSRSTAARVEHKLERLELERAASAEQFAEAREWLALLFRS